MSAIAEVFVRLRSDDTVYKREVSKQVKRAAQDAEKEAQAAEAIARARTRRTVAFATTGLLAIGTAAAATTIVVRKSISAAMEAQVSEAQLQNALQKSGISFEENKAAIDARVQALSQMAGFDDELVRDTFVNLVRRTNDVTKAMELETIAVNVARGRNLSLEAATQLVIRASLGMSGALRRVGIAAREGASATELLDLLQRKYAGSARTYGETAAGAQDRFRVSLENTGEIIGTAFLPTLTRLLDKTTAWLNDTKNQEKIQRATNDAVAAGVIVVEKLARGVGFVSDAIAIANGGDQREWTNWIKDVAGVAASLSDSLAPNVADNIERLSNAANQPPDDGWEDFFAGLLAVAHVGNIAALDQLEALRGNRDLNRQVRPDIPSKIRGATFGNVGAPLTPAQQLAIDLARTGGTGTSAEAAFTQAKLDADNRAIESLLKRIATGRGNIAKMGEQLEKLELDRRARLDRLAGIRAENDQRAAAAADKAERDRLAAIDALGLGRGFKGSLDAPGAFESLRTGLLQGTLGSFKPGGRANVVVGGIPPELALRLRIAEQTVTNEKKLIPLLNLEADAVRNQLRILRKTGATKLEILTATLDLATINRRIRDIRKQSSNAERFSAQDEFSLGASTFGQYGSNVAPLGGILSPQEAGGAAVRAARTLHITQVFPGEQPNPAQAMQSAANAARALRYG